MQKESEGRDELFAEWTRQVFGIVERDGKELNDIRLYCERCKQEVNRRLIKIEVRQAVLLVKMTAILTIISFAISMVVSIAVRYASVLF